MNVFLLLENVIIVKKILYMKKEQYVKDNWYIKTVSEIAQDLGIGESSVRRTAVKLGLPKKSAIEKEVSISEKIAQDISTKKEKSKAKDVESKYQFLLDEHEKVLKELDAFRKQSGKPHVIPKTVGSIESEAVAVALWSDWHLEEEVKKGWVGGKNEYNLTIAQKRAEECVQNTVRLLKKEQKDARIDRLIVWLGGDFITGNIHEENVETALLLPMEAMIFAENLIKGGIEYILNNTDVSLVIPCNAGNHSRITKKQRHSTDVGNSLETVMYYHLAEYFKNERRVTFVLQEGYHLILPVYEHFRIRFHHGHDIKYGGGIGGLYIPARKAIGQWQKVEPVELDCFGHFHNFKMDGDLFICNGSLIGWSPYAVAIKGDFERPRQTFFLVDKKHGKSVVAPIRITS